MCSHKKCYVYIIFNRNFCNNHRTTKLSLFTEISYSVERFSENLRYFRIHMNPVHLIDHIMT